MKNAKVYLATATRHQEAFFDMFATMFEELCILILGALHVEMTPNEDDYDHPMSYIGETTFGGIVVRIINNLGVKFDTTVTDTYQAWGRINIELTVGDAHTVTFQIDLNYMLGMRPEPTLYQECNVYVDDQQMTFEDITPDLFGDERVASFAGVLKAYLRQTGISEELIGTPAAEVLDD
ncbi:MAG: hypothetical protein J5614_08965 [Paludibacteraceae bacterium]|nr:hypothetical protein [Paludibacteraceae bacterium]